MSASPLAKSRMAPGSINAVESAWGGGETNKAFAIAKGFEMAITVLGRPGTENHVTSSGADDLSLEQMDDLVANLVEPFAIVAGNHQGRPPFAAGTERSSTDQFTGSGIHTGRWFVEQKHPRLEYQSGGQSHPLGLTTGEFIPVSPGKALGIKANQGQGRMDLPGPVLPGPRALSIHR